MLYRYICIEGNIGAGKTTLAEKLSETTGSRLILEEFENNPFLPLFYENPERYALQTELTFLVDRYKQLSSQVINMSLFKPYTISDYHIFKSRLFAANNLNDDDFRLYNRIFSVMDANLPNPDLMIYLHLEADGLLSNISRRGRSFEKSINRSYLNLLQEAYLKHLRQETRFPVILLNMKNYNFADTPEDLAFITDLLNKKFDPGITII